MKKIGLIGGTSPESTALYYESFIELSRKFLPENVYPEILIYSVNFEFVLRNMKGNLKAIAEKFNEILRVFEDAGVELAAMTANTMHLLYDMLDTSMEMVHIVDSVVKYSEEKSFKKLVLFGTKRTMESNLYQKRMERAGIEILIPDEEDREEIDNLIFEITARGVSEGVKRRALDIASRYVEMADAIILGCTELPLVLKDSSFEVIDTVEVHVKDIFIRAVES